MAETPRDAYHHFQWVFAPAEEVAVYQEILELSKRSPIPDREFLAHLGLFLTRASFSHLLYIHNLYLRALNTHGIIVEFGVRWGQNLALFTTFRHMYEPYNVSRKIVGFDTFEGFPTVSPEDGTYPELKVGALAVTPKYETFLEELLATQEKLAPRPNVKKFELVKGDVNETLPRYLEQHPETIVALAYFDLDIYKPTKRCLELIRPHLVKNSVVGFDELALAESPGETRALMEAWGLLDYRLIRDPKSNQKSFLVFE